MNSLSVDNAAQLIGISPATLRNWVKSGQISPVSVRPLIFSAQSILALKESIGTESFTRLNKRANKSASVNHFLPEEYAENTELVNSISELLQTIPKAHYKNIEYIVFLATLRLLETNNEIKKLDNSNFELGAYDSWRRESVKNIVCQWYSELDKNIKYADYDYLYQAINPCQGDDFLGLLYQSLCQEGTKSSQGSYYTPSVLVVEALSQISKPVTTFLDPCCGAGKYLLTAAKVFNLELKNIYGFDNDRIAAYIATINLLLAYKEVDETPHVYCLDALSELANGQMFCQTNYLINHIDVIATNPPWGAYKNNYHDLSTQLKSGETFALFIEKSIALLKKGGQLSFVLPESILNIKIHADIRELILKKTKIKNIILLGRKFTGVFTPVIRLDLIKETPNDDWIIDVEDNKNKNHIKQARFINNSQYVFDVATTTAEDEALLSKIYAVKHHTLAKNAQWALGIVTGDNNKYILQHNIADAEPIFRGSDVLPYTLKAPSSFIKFTPHLFQQVAPEHFFRKSEKLIYKFISKKLVFAYDNGQHLSLNSANILIPNIPNLSIKTVLALLNSAVFQYLFTKKFATHKVLRGDLEQLPFPYVSTQLQVLIDSLVDKAIMLQETPKELEVLIFQLFALTPAEIAIIKSVGG